jgi:putative transposase
VANWKAIKTGIIHGMPEWASETPYLVKSVAIRDCCIAVSAAKRKFKKTGQIQKVAFRSRKDSVQSIYIPKTAIRKDGIYPTMSGGKLLWAENPPKEFGDSRLVYHNEQWFVAFTVPVKRVESENQGRIVALDPGVRTFQTAFSETSCAKFGSGDFSRIQRLCCKADKLTSLLAQERKRLRSKRLLSALRRTKQKVRNLVDELHHKLALFLVKNFDVILLPTFETSGMVRKSGRKIRSKTARSMLTWSHFRFKQHLKFKAFEYKKIVLDVSEAWTSKTVCWTGEVNHKLGGSKTMKSAIDGQTMDRDIGGARGIFLRALGDNPILRAAWDESAPGDAKC